MTEDLKIEKVEESTEEEKKTSAKPFIVLVAAILVIFALLLSVKFFIPDHTGQTVTLDELHEMNLNGELDETQGYVYQGYSFIKVEGFWLTRVMLGKTVFEISLRHHPKELENITISGSLDPTFNEKETFYIAFNPELSGSELKYVVLASAELAQNIVYVTQKIPQSVCDRPASEESCGQDSIVDCSDYDLSVIHLRYEPGPSIELDQNCVIVRGQEDDIIKAAERLILQWFKVMD